MATEQIEVKIVLDDGSIQKGFFNIEKKAEQSANSISNNLNRALGTVGKIAGVVSAALGAISLKKAISESIEAENASVKLNLALRNLGLATRENIQSFSNYASGLEKTTGIESDLITENASLLVSLGKLSGDGLNRATKAAVDLSKGLSIDLGSAFDLVAKASTGNVTALSRYGLKINESIPQGEKFATTLKLIEQRFGGMAEAISNNTFSGSLDKLNVSMNNFFETIGNVITRSPVVRETFKFMSEAITNLTMQIDKFGKSGAFDNFIKLAVNDLLPTFKILTSAGEIFFRSLYTGFKAVQFIFQATVAIIAQAADAVIQDVIRPIGTLISKGLGAVVGLIDKETGKAITLAGENIVSSMSEFSTIATESTASVAQDSYAQLTAATEQTFSTQISGTINAFAENYANRINLVKDANNSLKTNFQDTAASVGSSALTVSGGFSSAFDGMKTAATDFAANATANFQQVGKAAFNTLGTGAANAFAAFGKAAAKGENALQAFADSLLATMGQMAVQLGSQFILQGIAYLWAGMPNGPSLIAAGAALAAFGGILSAAGGGSASASPAAGTSTAGGGIAIEPTTLAPEQTQPTQPGTVVNLNVEGSIFDSSETSSRLVSLLNDSFQNQGTTLVQA